MKNNYEERAKKFIQKIFPYIKDCEELYEVCDRVDEFNYDYDRNVQVHHGIARVALITSDYVIKFDYDPDEVENVGGCDAEVELYDQAEQDGFAYLFAKVTPYEYENEMFYIMPRIRNIRVRDHRAQYYMTDKERKWCDKVQLTDLHSYNYGFRDGKVCIIDYACSMYSDNY